MAVEETKVVPTDSPIVVPVGHTFMMNQRLVQLAVCETLDRFAA